jgi:hypothetical protein
VAAMSAAARQHATSQQVALRLLPGAGHDFENNMLQHGLGEIVARWLLS